jgi:fibronectin-binding autotransporter adhesin
MPQFLPARWRQLLSRRPLRRRTRPRSPATFRLGLEVLEERLAPAATRVWSGAGADNLWATAANWVGGAPNPGDDLIFPGGAAQLSNSNNYAAGTAFNSITIDGGGYTLNGNGITLGAGGLTVNSAAVGGFDIFNLAGITLGAASTIAETYAGATLNLESPVTTAGFTVTYAGSGNILDQGDISGAGNVVKNGPGSLSLVTAISDTGQMTLNAGAVYIVGGLFFGTGAAGINVGSGATLQLFGNVTVQESLALNGPGMGAAAGSTAGALEISGGAATLAGPVTLGSDATIGVDVGSGLTVAASPLALSGHTLTVNVGATGGASLPVVSGPGGLVVNSALTTGTVTITGASTYTGPTTVEGGTLSVGGGGALLSPTITVTEGGTFALDNSGTANPNRLPSGAAINLNGGTLRFIGNSTTFATETVGVITLTGGHSTIQVNPVSGAFLTRLTASRLARNPPGATVNFSSSGGTLGSATDQFTLTALPILVGNNGGILPYATYADNDFATYGANGIAQFTGYVNNLGSAGPNDIVKLTGSATVANTQTIAGLVLVNSTININAGIVLTLSSGGLILRSGAIRQQGGVATLNFGSEGYVFSNASANNSVTAQIHGTAGLDFSGPASGNLIINPGSTGNAYTGGSFINTTNVSIQGPTTVSPLGPSGSSVTLVGGSLSTNIPGGFTLANVVNFNGAVTTLGGNNAALTLSGAVTLNGSNAISVASGNTVTITGSIGGSGSLTEQGSGTLVLSPAVSNTYSGGTTLVSGTLGLASPSTPLGSGPLSLAGAPGSGSNLQTSVTGGLSLANALVLNNAPASAPNVAITGTSAITFSGNATLNGLTMLQVNSPVILAGPAGGSGGIAKSGAGTLTLSGSNNYSGATMVDAGILAINGSQPNSPVGVAGGTLSGTGKTGPISVGPGGNVTPGTPGGSKGILSAPSANFSEGGNLTIPVAAVTTPGTDYGQLNLGSGPLVVGGGAGGSTPSSLTLDLSGLTVSGQATGTVLYGSNLGSPTQFGELILVNNPTNFNASLVYSPNQLNVVFTTGIIGSPLTPPTTKIWTGKAGANWRQAGNWIGGLPANGDDLIFPAGAATLNTNNDFGSGTIFHSLTFEAGGYSISGNGIFLQTSLTTTEPTGSGNSSVGINIPITTGGNTSFVATYAGTTLTFTQAITAAGQVVFDGAGTTVVTGQVNGSGGILKTGPGTLQLFPAGAGNIYTGITTVSAGILAANNSTSLGASSSSVSVTDGATLLLNGNLIVAQALSVSGFGVGGAVPGNLAGAVETNGIVTLAGGITLAGDTWIGNAAATTLTISTNSVTLSGFTLTLNTVGTTAISTPIVDGNNTSPGTLAVNAALTTGTVSLTAANTYTGNTIVDAGTVNVNGASGALAGTAEIDLVGNIGSGAPVGNAYPGPGGKLIIDNTAGTADRIGNSTVLAFMGGTFVYRGVANGASSETIGAILVASGQSYLQMVRGAGLTSSVALVSDHITRDLGATLDFSGQNLGQPSDQILFTGSTPDTSTAGIMPWATVSPPTAPGNLPVSDYATYIVSGTPKGIVAFTGYVTQLALAGPNSVLEIISPVNGPPTVVEIKQNKTIGALLLRNGSIVQIDPGVTLTTNYGILTSGTGAPAIEPFSFGGDLLEFGSTSTDAVIMPYSPTTISAEISGSVNLTLAGVAPLHLACPTGNSYDGNTTLDSGTVVMDDTFGFAFSTITFVGGTLDFPSSAGQSVFLDNDVAFVNSNVNFIAAAPISVDFTGFFGFGATVSGQNTLNLSQNVTLIFDGEIDDGTDPSGNLIPGNLTVTGGGTLVLNDFFNTYSGGTTLVGLGGALPTLVLGDGYALGGFFGGTLTLVSGTLAASTDVGIPNDVSLLSANVTLGQTATNTGGIFLDGTVTLTGINQVTETAVVTEFTGTIDGTGTLSEVGGATVTADQFQSGATSSTVGIIDMDGFFGTADVAKIQGVLDGNGSVGYISAGSGGIVEPGFFGQGSAGIGTLSAAGANFSNDGTLMLRVAGYTTPGTDYDQLNVAGGDLVVGGTSRLVLDLGGLTASSGVGTAVGVVLYHRLLGNVPVFSEVDIINNPLNYTVELDYTTTGLNVRIALGAVDVPVITVPAAQNSPEDIPLVFSPGNGNPVIVTDTAALNPLQVTLTVTTGTLTLGSTAGLIGLSGNGSATVKFNGSPAAVTNALNGLIFTPGNDYIGSSLLTITVTNPGDPIQGRLLGSPQTATASVAITVFQTADAPTFVVGQNESVADNAGAQSFSPWATNVQGEAPNTGNLNGLVFTTKNDNPSLFSVQPQVTLSGNTGVLTFTPQANTDGVADVTVTLSNTFPDGDGDQDSFSQTFTITVINHNAPAVNDVIIHWGKQSASLLSILQNNPNRKDVPFQNITAIDLVFNEDVTVSGSPFSIIGKVLGNYTVSAPTYLPGHTVEWRLFSALGGLNGVDKLNLNLLANGVRGKRNGKLLGSNYALNFNVLVGDANGDGVVDLQDQLLVMRSLTIKYSGINFCDIDGDGSVSMLDFNIVLLHNGRRLPP